MSPNMITAAEMTALCEIAKGEGAINMHGERARVRLKNKGLVWRDEYEPWEWHLTDEGLRALPIMAGT